MPSTKRTSPDTFRAKVFVGLSGGVDSAVSAALLKESGYDVTGVFIKTWTPDSVVCAWREERRDAMRVAARLEIPFLFLDLSDEYKRGVADYMVGEYRRGRTPNPDVMCNREVKFGAFWQRAKAMGADYIATGHYARIASSALQEGRDKDKDQSYFLWTLTQSDLSHTLFPIGHLQKSEVRRLAKRFDLPVSEKKDSQGICFIGEVSLEEFLKEFVTTEPGDVLNTKGKVIGRHHGALYYTPGERHGFEVSEKSPADPPYYVLSKDMAANTITVSNNPAEIEKRSPVRVAVTSLNWLSKPEIERKITARIRYRGEKIPIETGEEGVGLEVAFPYPQRGLAPGQSIVFYDGETLLGGGIMDAIL